MLKSTVVTVACLAAATAWAQQDDEATRLAKQTQNPVSDLISVPLQDNFNFNTGSFNRLQYTGLLQPVAPIGLGPDWKVIVRPILPFTDQPVGASYDRFGLGDLTLQTYFSPRAESEFVWGVGPVAVVPTRSDPVLGNGMWGGGAGGLVLVKPGPWVIGALVNHVWSIGSPASDQSTFSLTTLQPFINYNFGHGLAVGFVSQSTRDGARPDGQQWTIPLGGTVSQVLTLGRQPISLSVGAFYNVARPTDASDWQLRFQITLLFPEGR